LGYHSSSFETMAVIFCWCGVTTPNTGKRRSNARPDPFGRQPRQSVQAVWTLNPRPRCFLNEPAGLLDYVAAAACQNTITLRIAPSVRNEIDRSRSLHLSSPHGE
jgi:hypothetical protein